jgi:hypothetical protein
MSDEKAAAVKESARPIEMFEVGQSVTFVTPKHRKPDGNGKEMQVLEQPAVIRRLGRDGRATLEVQGRDPLSGKSAKYPMAQVEYDASGKKPRSWHGSNQFLA